MYRNRETKLSQLTTEEPAKEPIEKEKEKGRSLTSPGDPLVLNYNYIKPKRKSADFRPKVCGKYAL